jgi:tetratricopeptide (TPR) repeat protein
MAPVPRSRTRRRSHPRRRDSTVRARLAQLAQDAGDPVRARRELRQLLVHDHANVMAARRLLALGGDAPEAASDRDFALRLIADLDPFDANAHAQLGRRLLESGRLAPALTEFRAALALGPANLAEAHTDLAEALFKLGRKDEAKRQVILALEQAPGFARAQDLLLAILGRH